LNEKGFETLTIFPNIDEEKNIIREESFTPDENKAVFYSGKGNEERAYMAFERGEVQPIYSTIGGNRLYIPDRRELYTQEISLEMWEKASTKYAESARGQVQTFVCGARADGVFRSVELEELINNEKVTEINGVPRERFQKAFRESPRKAFEEICKTELDQAKSLAMQKGDKAMFDDVEKRSQTFQTQRERENSQAPQRSLEQNKPVEKSAPPSGSTHPLMAKYGPAPDPAKDKEKPTDKDLDYDR
jgi:hypothetical protein